MSQPMLRRCRMELAASVVVFPELRVSPQAAHLCRHLGMRGSSQLRYIVINGSVAEHHGVFLLQFILVCPACIQQKRQTLRRWQQRRRARRSARRRSNCWTTCGAMRQRRPHEASASGALASALKGSAMTVAVGASLGTAAAAWVVAWPWARRTGLASAWQQLEPILARWQRQPGRATLALRTGRQCVRSGRARRPPPPLRRGTLPRQSPDHPR